MPCLKKRVLYQIRNSETTATTQEEVAFINPASKSRNDKLRRYCDEFLNEHIEKHHLAIVTNGYAYDKDTYRRHLLNSLLSGPNSVFNTKIQSIKRDVDSGYGFHANISPHKLIASAKQQYVNIEKSGEWNKVDPKDATIMALTTALKQSTEIKATSTSKDQGSSGSDDKILGNLDKWRTINVGKAVEQNGKTWIWCPYHKHTQGLFDGLYYSNHTPETHDAWRANRKKPTRGALATAATPTTAPTSALTNSLQVSDALKNALCTNLCISEDDLSKIIEAVTDQEN